MDVMLHASLISEADKTEWPASQCEWYVPQGSVPGYETPRFLEALM